MKNSQLLQLFEALQRKELNELGRFIKFKSRSDDMLKLFKYLKQYYPDFKNSSALEKQKVAEKIYDGEEKKLRSNMTRLSKEIQNFFISKELEHKMFYDYRNVLLMYAYKRRKIDKYLFQLIDKLKTDAKNDKKRDMSYYYLQARLNHEKFYHPNFSKLHKKEQVYNLFKEMIESLDTFYVLAKARYNSTWQTWRHIVNIPYHDTIGDVLNEKIKEVDYLKSPLIEIYQKAIVLIRNQYTNQTYDEYETLKRLINEHRDLAKPEEKVLLYELLINYAGLKFNNGVKRFSKEVWLLYRYGLKHGILSHEGYLPNEHFNNILHSGLNIEINKIEWLKKEFIPKYGQLLNAKKRDSTLAFAKAQIAFKEKNYTIIEPLLETANKDIELKFRVSCLIIKTRYELMEWEELYKKLKAFNKFLNDNKEMSESMILQNKNFIKIIRRIARLKESYKFKPKTKVIIELQQIEDDLNMDYANKVWVNTKFIDLKRLLKI